MRHFRKESNKRQAGFTLIELMVTVVLIGMVIGLAGVFFNFSFTSEKKVEDEFSLQASMRRASETLNNSIRKATVTFTLTKDVFKGTKKDKWNYFGVENGTDVVQYIWDGTKHERIVLLKAETGISYNLYFKQNTPGSKLIEFTLECVPNGNDNKKITVKTELSALNSVAVDNGGSAEDPAVAIAYRSDPTPTPENVSIAVSLVLDTSGSMDRDMGGHDPPQSGDRRITILKRSACSLIDTFAKYRNFKVSLIPFSSSANGLKAMADCTTTAAAATIKTNINALYADGATNTGDGLRQAYYQLEAYNTANASSTKKIANYIILLTDGNPTLMTVIKEYDYTDWWGIKHYKYTTQKTTSGQCDYTDGSGSDADSDNVNYCMGYVRTIGEQLVVGKSLDINTFVIGFSAKQTEISRANDIAGYCTANPANPVRTGKYYLATDQASLDQAFGSIATTILQETWHIYGPY
jgi:prepilin-type N-terminal cleavage/methylation domain-containing protein